MDYSREFTDQISVRLPPHWLQLLKEDAKYYEVTVADLVRVALNDAYDMCARGHKRIVETRDQATLPYVSCFEPLPMPPSDAWDREYASHYRD